LRYKTFIKKHYFAHTEELQLDNTQIDRYNINSIDFVNWLIRKKYIISTWRYTKKGKKKLW